MKEKFKNYLNNDYKFDKPTLIGIICLIIVISGILVGYMNLFFTFLIAV